MKHNNIWIIGIPEREEKEQGIETLFEKIMTANFLSLERGKALQVQEAQRVLVKMNPKRPTLRPIIIKMSRFKDKEWLLKAARKKWEVTYKWAPIRLAADFSTETLQAREERQEVFPVMKSKGLKPRLLNPMRLSIKMEGKIRSFLDKRRLKIYLHQTSKIC